MSIVKNFTKSTRVSTPPKLYVITILVDSPLNDTEIEERVNTFFHSLPSNDGSFNIMYADKKLLAQSRRVNKIG